MAFDNTSSKPEQTKVAAAEGPSNLQCEAWQMSKSSNATIDAALKRLQGDEPIDGPYKSQMDRQFGGQSGFIRQMGQDLRSQYHLPGNAPPEQVYQKMAADAVALFPTMSRVDKAAGLASLQLDSASMRDESKIFKALIDRDRREAGLPVLSLAELEANKCSAMQESELAGHLRSYKDAVKNGIRNAY